MRLMRFEIDGAAHAGVVRGGEVIPVSEINARLGTSAPDDILGIIETGGVAAIRDFDGVEGLPLDRVKPLLPYENPARILCVGPNFGAKPPDADEPGSFLKSAACLAAPGSEIALPPARVSSEVDGEGELGIVIGKKCRFVPIEEAGQVIFGYTLTLDLGAKDVLRRSARYLTRSKNLDGFCSFGPVIVTPDEISDVRSLEVITEVNGAVFSRALVREMLFSPSELVSFHSDYMTFRPGDLISTGCPKAAPLNAGDRLAARIPGLGVLEALMVN